MRIQEPPQQRQKFKHEKAISRLLNSIYYFLDCVFIIFISKAEYRLVVIGQERVMMNASYNTLRGAKIAFAKFFSDRAWGEKVQPKWSNFYHPQLNWMNKKLRFLKKDSRPRSLSLIKKNKSANG